MQNYTGYGWEGSNYDKNLSTVDIAKIIKKQLKQEFPNCKFSVTSEYYAGGSSLSIHLMESPFRVSNDPAFKGHISLNQYQFSDSDLDESVNNGYKITPQAFYIFREVVRLINSYNYDDSDSMIDYFSTNFYFHPHIGKWDKPYKIIN